MFVLFINSNNKCIIEIWLLARNLIVTLNCNINEKLLNTLYLVIYLVTTIIDKKQHYNKKHLFYTE